MPIRSIPSLLLALSGTTLAFGQNVVSRSDEPKPITQERVRWFFTSTLGPTSLLVASVAPELVLGKTAHGSTVRIGMDSRSA